MARYTHRFINVMGEETKTSIDLKRVVAIKKAPHSIMVEIYTDGRHKIETPTTDAAHDELVLAWEQFQNGSLYQSQTSDDAADKRRALLRSGK